MADATALPVSDDPLGLVCPECGYDLRAIASDRCPECGQTIDRAAMSVSRLHWSHRHAIGRFRAYWRTNLLVIVRSKRLADEIARPVSFADARQFRLVTALFAWLPIAAWAAGLVIANWQDATAGLRSVRPHLAWWLEVALCASLLFAAWVFLVLASGMPSYFFHPPSLPIVSQNRAVALSYYTSAPLAWLWVPASLIAILFAMSSQDWAQHGWGDRLAVVVVCAAFGATVAIPVVCWLRAGKLMQRVTHCGRGRTALMAVCLPISWAVSGAVALLIPATILYGSLILLSFR